MLRAVTIAALLVASSAAGQCLDGGAVLVLTISSTESCAAGCSSFTIDRPAFVQAGTQLYLGVYTDGDSTLDAGSEWRLLYEVRRPMYRHVAHLLARSAGAAEPLQYFLQVNAVESQGIGATLVAVRAGHPVEQLAVQSTLAAAPPYLAPSVGSVEGGFLIDFFTLDTPAVTNTWAAPPGMCALDGVGRVAAFARPTDGAALPAREALSSNMDKANTTFSIVFGPRDGGTADAGLLDAGLSDAGALDAGPLDAGLSDAGAPDAGALDAGLSDAGAPDAGTLDAGPTDSGPLDGGASEQDGGLPDPQLRDYALGCGCSGAPGPMAAALALLVAARRRGRDEGGARIRGPAGRQDEGPCCYRSKRDGH